ncbi:Glycosyl transferases group 1 [Streptomyces zhaozhouensis]|uniref:D-inositol 3-phosphate glycosyltransferase n=1 Tax=Streptomyces zhaozhouensis TaxID=1300267 RepID=A0A286DWX0_9ACTN|nr:glycosyltransferase family 4 protein [Streptomyces zhaozhouensis]SOD63158.1 Glycosyl transferases group 1 [Streptomyces zhaozhouensis]
MKITFLLHNAYGIGGTIRSAANLSAALVERHEVTVASLYCHRDTPGLDFDPRVRLLGLIDQREGSKDLALPEAGQPSQLFPASVGGVSALSDQRMSDYLTHTDADVVISTRPVLNVYLARYGVRGRYLRIGQEHSTLAVRDEAGHRELQLAAVAQLDAFAPVSSTDAAAYRAALPEAAARIRHIPNSSPAAAVSRSTGENKLVVTAGRLVAQKRYDVLIDAFARLRDDFPDWELRIYGRGPLREPLLEQVERLDLGGRVRLMGAVAPIDTEWAKGAIGAVSSSWESFGLTIVEAMACGLPVVSRDCPYGPAEIITPGEDGVLVPMDEGDEGLAEGLRRLMADPALRARMAENAVATAARYEPAVVAEAYEELFAARPRGGGLRRLRTRLRRRPDRRLVVAASADAPARPAARCVAAPDGLTLALTPAEPGDLVLRLRDDPEGRQVRLPLDREGRGRVSRAEHQLAEGRWDAYVTASTAAKARRLVAHRVEGAALVGAAPAVGEHGVTSWIPYTTKEGNLTVRAWQRPAHAEVADITLGEEAALVTVTPHGPPTEVALAVRQQEPDVLDFTIQLRVLPTGRVLLTIPYADAVREPHGRWSLVIRSADGTLVPLGRIGGDTVDRRPTDVYPAVNRREGTFRLGYTGDNALILTTTPPAG